MDVKLLALCTVVTENILHEGKKKKNNPWITLAF